jgi:taurine dioxygenase
MGSLPLAREVPPHGGDTMFANQHLAYEAPVRRAQGDFDG